MSKIVVTMPVRNEAWILGLSARAALLWADHLVILEHCSDAATLDILADLTAEFGARLSVIHEAEPTWEEMRHRQRLLTEARDARATHVVIVDADEVLTANLLPHIRQHIENTPNRTIAQLPWLQLRGGITEYHAGAGVWADQWVSFAFCDDPAVYHWAQRDGYDFHHRQPMGRQLVPFRPVPRKVGGLMHLQMASERRLRAKQALYKITEVIRWPGRKTVAEIDRMYNVAVYGQETRRNDPFPMAQVPREWWQPYQELIDRHLRVHADPWQEAECRRLYAEHGAAKFAGLDLFGVCG